MIWHNPSKADSSEDRCQVTEDRRQKTEDRLKIGNSRHLVCLLEVLDPDAIEKKGLVVGEFFFPDNLGPVNIMAGGVGGFFNTDKDL